MKKAISILAMTLMIIGLTGCIDGQDNQQQKVSSTSSTIQL